MSAIRLIQIKQKYTELIIFNLNLITISILLVSAQPYLILSSSLGFITVHRGHCISSFLRYTARPRAPLGVKRSGSGSAVEQVRYEWANRKVALPGALAGSLSPAAHRGGGQSVPQQSLARPTSLIHPELSSRIQQSALDYNQNRRPNKKKSRWMSQTNSNCS